MSIRKETSHFALLLPPCEIIRFHGQLLDSAVLYDNWDAVMLHTEKNLKEYLDNDDGVFVLLRTLTRTEEQAFTNDYHVVNVIGNKAIVSNSPDA